MMLHKTNEKLWQELQNLEHETYKKTHVGVFSVEGMKGAEVTGKMMKKYIGGKTCLDIGCGVLPHPYYMKVADGVKFTGIDPFDEEVSDRKYTFKQGYAEKVEYPSKKFYGVLFATSLDHVKSPVKAMTEAYRVLKDNGYLFIWISIRKNNWKYKLWKMKNKPTRYNKHHMWAYTHDDLMCLIGLTNFVTVDIRTVSRSERIYVFKKVI